MAIFTAIGTAVAGALFGGSMIAASLIAAGLAYGAQMLMQYLARPKARPYSAVQGEVQYGATVPATAMFGPGKVKGHHIFYAKWGEGNKYNADVFVLANGWCDGLEPEIYFYGEKHALRSIDRIGNEAAHYAVTGFGYRISIRFYDGRPGQGVDTKLVADTADLGQNWKETSVCAGLTYVVVERLWDEERLPRRPDFEFILRGLREYDPRRDSTVAGGSGPQRLDNPSTWVYTQNPAVHRLNYQLGLRGRISGRTLIGEGKSLGQIDLGSYIAAMNACDTLRGGKPTYQCSLYVTGDDDHTEILKEFDDAMAGYALNRRGLSGVIAGAPQIPVAAITRNDIPVGRAQELKHRKSAFNRFNHLSGQFISRENHWNPDSLKPIMVNADVAADGRPRQTSNDFLQVTDPDIAQYLLQIRYRQNRKGGAATVPVSRRLGLRIQEGNWVTFDGKTWLVTGWRCDDALRITLELAETGADVYSSAGIVPGPIVVPPTPPVNPSLGSTVQNLSIEAGIIAGPNGRQVPCLRFTWDPPNDPTITGVRFQYAVGLAPDLDDLQEDMCNDPQAGRYVTTKNVVPGEFYVGRATIRTVPDRFKVWTPWVVTSNPTGLLFADVLDDSITSDKIRDAAITASKLMDEAVTSIKLADEAVSTAKIQVGAVTEQLVASGAIVADKLADLAVTQQKLANGAVDLTKFASGLRPVEIVTSLPTSGNFAGRVVFFNGELYRHTGSPAGASGFSKSVGVGDLTGQITSTQITDSAITTAKIAANAITANELAANSVTTGAILAGAVTASEIAANAITTVKINANAVTTAKIATNAITANELAANSVLAGNIQANAVTTQKIAAGAVTAVELAAGAVTAEKVQAGSITGDKIAASSVTGDKFVANSITAREMILTDFENLVYNSNLVTTDGWSLDSDVVYQTESDLPANATAPGNFYTANTTGARSAVFSAGGADSDQQSRIVCVPGEELIAGMRIRPAGNTRQATPYIRIDWYDKSGAYLTNNVRNLGAFGSTAYNDVSTIYVVPDTAVTFHIRFGRRGDFAGEAGGMYIERPYVRRRKGADLIVDGAIVADKLAANSVTAGAIASNAVTAVKVAAGAITTQKLSVGGVTTDRLAISAASVASVTTRSTQQNNTGSWATYLTLNMSVDVACNMQVLAGVSMNFANNNVWELRLVVNGTAVWTVGGQAIADAPCLLAMVAIPVGSSSIQLQQRGNASVGILAATLSAVAAKR